MAFQLSQPQFREFLRQIAVVSDHPGLTPSQIVDAMTPNEKERKKLMAVWMIADRCHKEGRDIMRVKKVVAWRTPKESNFDLEIEFENGIA